MAVEAFSASVVIPAFNEAERIGETIAAIRSQSEAPFEILLIDDGSTDGTSEVAAAAGARVIRQENAGVSAARNRGILAAAGSWVAFCDADDAWTPGKLEAVRRVHELRPEAGFLFADCAVETDGRITMASMFADAREFSEHVSERLAKNAVFFERSELARAISKRNFVPTSTVVVRRDVLVENGVFFDTMLERSADYFVAEDLEWYLRVLRFTDALAVDDVLEIYRQRAGSLSSNRSRMHSGLVKLGELVTSSPAKYAPGAAEAFALSRRRHLVEAAAACVREIRFSQGRQRLREALRLGFDWKIQLLYVLATVSTLPGMRGVAAGAVRSWQRVVKPALRTALR